MTFTIGQVTETLYGKSQFFGIIETLWESKSAMEKDMAALKTNRPPKGKTIEEDFSSQVGKAFSVLVEEFIVNHWRSRFQVYGSISSVALQHRPQRSRISLESCSAPWKGRDFASLLNREASRISIFNISGWQGLQADRYHQCGQKIFFRHLDRNWPESYERPERIPD